MVEVSERDRLRVIRATLERVEVDLLTLRLMVSAFEARNDDVVLRHSIFDAWLKADEAWRRVNYIMSTPAPGNDRQEITIHD